MTTPLESLVACGTKLWLDSVDPELTVENKSLGATGATSNPVIISKLISTGRFDNDLQALMGDGLSNEEVAWRMTDKLVGQAQEVFRDVHERTNGDDGYVSFELDPLLEAEDCPMTVPQRTERYIELGKLWSKGHTNRMIKVPATEAGLGALEELAAHGVTLNVTLIFTERQYQAARDAIWKGAQRRDSLDQFKSVYSIFVSRIDVYTQKNVPELSDEAQGKVGLVNAKRLWKQNSEFWADKNLPLKQEIIFASTGVKTEGDPPDMYISALAGADIQTNPPETNAEIQGMEGKTFEKRVDQLPAESVQKEIDEKVDFAQLEDVLMQEGLKKFADPQKGLLETIQKKREALAPA